MLGCWLLPRLMGILRASSREYSTLEGATGGKLIRSDGLHLSTKGYNVFWLEYCKLVKGPLKGRGLDWEDLEDCPPRVPLYVPGPSCFAHASLAISCC
jgi:hypothetical protein